MGSKEDGWVVCLEIGLVDFDSTCEFSDKMTSRSLFRPAAFDGKTDRQTAAFR